jgi:putative membrane protein
VIFAGRRPAAADEGTEPRRLHPATMLIALVRGAPSTLLGIPALLAIGARAELWFVLAGTAAVLVVTGAFRWLAWTRFTYALSPDAVVIERGVFSRSRRTIPYERVADVGIERRPLQRLFGLASVTLETGGAGANEGSLDSVSLVEAERIRHFLRSRRTDTGHATAIANVSGTNASEQRASAPLFAMTVPRVLLWGLFNFSLVWIALAFGAVQYLDGPLGFDASAIWDAVLAKTGSVRSMPAIVIAGTFAVGATIIFGIGVAAGLIRTTLREYGFTLTDEDGRLRRQRGLFTRSEAIIPLPRVQLGMIDDGLLRRRLGWSRLRAQVLGGEGAGGLQDLAPFAREDEVDRILDVLKLRRSHPDELKAVARGHVLRALLRQVGRPALLILGASLVTPLAMLATPLLLPLVVAALLARRHHRYLLSSGLLQVQRGVLSRTTWIAPVSRIQVLSLRRSWLQRRMGLATVLVDTVGAGGSDGPNIHDLRHDNSRELIDRLRRIYGRQCSAGPQHENGIVR